MRLVQVLTTQDVTAVIKSGLKNGETIVTDGQMTLHPGSTVAPRPPAGATGGNPTSKKPAA